MPPRRETPPQRPREGPLEPRGGPPEAPRGPKQPLRALTYSRVSTGRQAESGLSLDDQEERLATAVAQRGWEHVAHLTDPGVSGRKLSNQPGLQEAIDRLDRGEAQVLLAAKLDRLSRSTLDFAQLLEHAGRKGWSVVVLDVAVDTSSPAGRLVVDVVSAAAAFESRRIGERVAASHVQRKAKGERAGQAPLLPDAIRQRIVREHNDEQRSLNAIAKTLNAEEVPTAMGGRWHASTVRHVLRSVSLDEELARNREVQEAKRKRGDR